jgi:hypothetical protein
MGGAQNLTTWLAMAFEVKYVAVGCNQTPHSADWSVEGVLAYCAGESIALSIKEGVSEYQT